MASANGVHMALCQYEALLWRSEVQWHNTSRFTIWEEPVPRNVTQRDAAVLLVDDDSTILTLLSIGLEQAGFRVISAQSPADAVRKAKSLGRLDVLATDLILADPSRLSTNPVARPTRHGFDLSRRMLELHPDLKVVLFSGYSAAEVNDMIQIPQGTPFLQKPFTPDTLARTIRRLLDKPVHSKTLQIKAERKPRVWRLP
jgi:two-component system, cell cycle sensor histidine kinase and response regulator CckA